MISQITLDVSFLDELEHDESRAIILQKLLSDLDFHNKVLAIKGMHCYTEKDRYPSIWINLAERFEVDKNKDLDFSQMSGILMNELGLLPFSNLQIHDCGINGMCFDEFYPKFKFRTLENDVKNVLSDLKLIDTLLKEFEVVYPRKLSIKRKEV